MSEEMETDLLSDNYEKVKRKEGQSCLTIIFLFKFPSLIPWPRGENFLDSLNH